MSGSRESSPTAAAEEEVVEIVSEEVVEIVAEVVAPESRRQSGEENNDPNASASMETQDANASGERTIRGRAGFRCNDLNTIPANLTGVVLSAGENASGQPIHLLSNFVKIQLMADRYIYAYRVDFEPSLESVSTRKRLFRYATKDILGDDLLYDGMSDARSASLIKETQTELKIAHPRLPDTIYTITIKRTGIIAPQTGEMLRLYNMNMKKCFDALGFFQVSKSGSYVHPKLSTPIGNGNTLMAVRGYKTATNMHDSGDIMMKMEACHKLMQKSNVLQYMEEIRNMGGNVHENCKAKLIGKLVVTSYNKIIYKVEDINFQLNPRNGFKDKKTGKDVTFQEYFKLRYNTIINDACQPLLLVVQNNKRSREEKQGETREIYVVPELCNIAGLTDEQRVDNRLKTDLIRSSQISPKDRVAHMEVLVKSLTENKLVQQVLNKWGYWYDTELVGMKGRILPMESIGVGSLVKDRQKWPKADYLTGSFESKVMRESLAEAPELNKFAILMPRMNCDHRQKILGLLRQGMEGVGLKFRSAPRVFDLPNDTATQYLKAIRSLPEDVDIIVIVLQNQNKERYDAIKKLACNELGLVTQVVTSKLLLDERKARGASTKIAIQIAAKIGGEPWYVDIPLVGDMICGYDTYHDTADRGRSYGAFIASMNTKFSRWYSKADQHKSLDEITNHMSDNIRTSLERFRDLNGGKIPKRIFIYRDGVGDGQIDHVYKTELVKIKDAIEQFNENIKLTFVIVNKQVGARFYMKNTNNQIINPTPGSVIDNTVTRRERYDFYLISQSTRNGTVAPTYYNIIFDESGLDPAKHQMLAYKLCFLYYNWTGTVRVPAPCQYAHKLALLCGEHMHNAPNSKLNDLLHFL